MNTQVAAPAAGSAAWCNPVVPQRADPHLSLHDGRYCFTASVPEFDAIELRVSADLAGLAEAPAHRIWTRHAQGPMSCHVWAPELHRVDGRWIVYFAASEVGDIWKLRMYVLENSHADPLQGEWVERGQIATPMDTFALDATRFEHGGRAYLCWAQKDPAIAGNTNLYLAELANAWTLKGAPVRISQPELPWECIGFLVNEGPAMLRRHGRVIVSYSASATDANYCMGLLWADEHADLLDPAVWHKSPTPVFVSGNGQFGPGHNSFTTTPDGQTDLLVYHARNYREIDGDPLFDPNRHTRIQAFAWTAEGLPDFGAPVADGACTAQSPGAAARLKEPAL
ncbi:glycoside hydrolase family 43 protein [Roseateles koreensis]|uniref:Glycoside hydrolase family 43 protein n=1 Tax=Roseateles koreensis TaxID=2987526 RepID=A0ABT5KUH3_9BURK|nr:glycoside hydrolase family 43 protein [Roseateles koreensis]MDC8786477.1 glycoside hydrolase family 43 protein [Roseateles koreensis]